MTEFRYRGMLRNGKIVRNVLAANNKREIINKLKLSGIQPIIIRQRKTKLVSESKKRMSRKKLEALKQASDTGTKSVSFNMKLLQERLKELFAKPIKPKDILTLTNSLYILKKAKFNNVMALETLYDTTENPRLRDAVDEILVGVEGGARISDMMAAYPKIFPPLYVNFVKVGEDSGALDTALVHARDYMESSMKLKKQIKGILLPKIIQFALILVAMVIALLYGAPMIQGVYDTFGVDKQLPQATLIAIAGAEWITTNWYVVIVVILGIIAIYKAYVSTAFGKYQVDKIKVKFSVFGRLNLNIITNKFFQAMLLNLRNGLRIQDALETSKAVTSNLYFLSLIEAGKNNLLAGGTWIEPFAADKALPIMVIEMVNIGMKTDLVEMMEKVYEYLQQEIDETISKTIKALPEITYIFIGIVLVFFVITVLIPLIDVYMGGFLFDTI